LQRPIARVGFNRHHHPNQWAEASLQKLPCLPWQSRCACFHHDLDPIEDLRQGPATPPMSQYICTCTSVWEWRSGLSTQSLLGELSANQNNAHDLAMWSNGGGLGLQPLVFMLCKSHRVILSWADMALSSAEASVSRALVPQAYSYRQSDIWISQPRHSPA
jgi:hypothetical protein